MVTFTVFTHKEAIKGDINIKESHIVLNIDEFLRFRILLSFI